MAKNKKYYAGNPQDKEMGPGRYADNGMIKEDRSQPALLPDRVIDKDWPQVPRGMGERYVDLYSGVNRSMKKDAASIQRLTSPDPEFY